VKKSITIKKLIKELKNYNKELEIFVANTEKQQFDGLSNISIVKTASDDKEFILLIAKGDIVKI